MDLDKASLRSVMVRIKARDSRKQKGSGRPSVFSNAGVTSVSASGVVLSCNGQTGEALILTTATIISPFLVIKHNASTENVIHNTDVKLQDDTQIDVLVEDKLGGTWLGASFMTVIQCDHVHEVVQGFQRDWEVGWRGLKDDAISQACWLGYDCVAVFAVTFGNLSASVANASDAIVAVDLKSPQFEFISQPFPSPSQSVSERGTSLYVISSPHGLFHPTSFLNYVFHGSVSNQFLSSNGSVGAIMCDFACLPGCEGGAVYSTTDGSYVGMVMPPLFQRDSNIELTLIIPAVSFLEKAKAWIAKTRSLPNSPPDLSSLALMKTIANKSLQSISTTGSIPAPRRHDDGPLMLRSNTPPWLASTLKPNQQLPNTNSNSNSAPSSEPAPSFMTSLQRIVPLIVVGSSWGSGVIIANQGDSLYVVTCAHVLKAFKDNIVKAKIRVKLYSPDSETPSSTNGTRTLASWLDASLLFISQSYIDIALLRVAIPSTDLFRETLAIGETGYPKPLSTNSNEIDSAPLALSALRKGRKVVAVGHGLFRPTQGLPPSVTIGIISKIVSVRGESVMIQTSCDIHSGYSGGGLFDFATKELIGIITQNTSQNDGVILSKLNCSFPWSRLKQPLYELMWCDKESAEKNLNAEDIEAANIWALRNPEIQGPGISPGFQEFIKHNSLSKL